ncbi:testis-specific Y-encoded protein 3-like [Lemur catta]|uniref:testis-specific Y-encoded protein 3-like n=1 Tax=Lemur catta TaxID=9447 RepID=UPI001E26916B|nr:testis-specific Y-encoded protein 3-like [Lemur catta]
MPAARCSGMLGLRGPGRMLSRQPQGHSFGPKARRALRDGSQAGGGAGPASLKASILPPIGGSERQAREGAPARAGPCALQASLRPSVGLQPLGSASPLWDLPACPSVAADANQHQGHMAGETGPGASEPPREAWHGPGLGRALQEAEAQGPPGEPAPGACGARAVGWAVQLSVCGTTEGGVVLSVGGLPECVTLAEPTGEEEVLVVEDILEAVEVVAEEEEDDNDDDKEDNEDEDSSQAQAGRCVSASSSPLEALELLELELSTANAADSKVFARLKLKLRQRQKAYLERRRAIIQAIPGFWARAIVYHPQLSAVITEQDKDVLSYMINLEVEEIKHPKSCYRILLFFGNKTYFRKKVVTKEYLVNITEFRAPHSAPVEWYQDYEHEAHSHAHQNSSLNFFNWFSDHNFTDSYTIAELITEDLCLTPLCYYTRMKAPAEETEDSYSSCKR